MVTTDDWDLSADLTMNSRDFMNFTGRSWDFGNLGVADPPRKQKRDSPNLEWMSLWENQESSANPIHVVNI